MYSCNDVDEDINESINDQVIISEDEKANKEKATNEQDQTLEEDLPENLALPLEFTFSHLEGKCFDSEGREGYNLGLLTECGSMQDEIIENENLDVKNLYGLKLTGARIIDSKLGFHKLAMAEVQIDGDTGFPENIKYPHTSFFISHANSHRTYKKLSVNYQEKVASQREVVKILKAAYKEINKLDTKKREKALANIKKAQDKLNEFKMMSKIQGKKSRRQLSFLIKSYRLANSRELKFNEVSLKNKKHLILEEDKSFRYLPSNQVIQNDKHFAISLWFKTGINQNDKRLINFHRGDNFGSALNMSVKNDRLVLGLHDGNQYHSVEKNINYSDDEWHHYVVTKHKNKFTGYLDGEKVLEYELAFSGFGSAPMTLGSYNNNGYFFEGSIDEVTIWDRSFSKSDVKRVFNKGKPGNVFYHKKVPYLLHWWRMGDHKKDSEESLFDVVSKTYMNIYQN